LPRPASLRAPSGGVIRSQVQGLNVDIPVSLFTEDAGSPEGGTGRRFFTKDHRADLTIQSVPIPGNESPAEFLQKRRPPSGIQYKRVTPRFFAVSSIRNDRTWYNRCNRANGYMHCVLAIIRRPKIDSGMRLSPELVCLCLTDNFIPLSSGRRHSSPAGGSAFMAACLVSL
jgi:hypothetical protein